MDFLRFLEDGHVSIWLLLNISSSFLYKLLFKGQIHCNLTIDKILATFVRISCLTSLFLFDHFGLCHANI